MKKQWLLTKKEHQKKSYDIIAVDDANELMFNGSVKYYWLKKKLKIFKYLKNYDYYEEFENGYEVIIIHFQDPGMKKCFFLWVIHNPYNKCFRIQFELRLWNSLDLIEPSENSRNFDLFRNAYVTQHFKEFVCVWTRLAFKYENFEVYENIIDEYIFYRENLKKYVRMIEMGCRFRKQCWMHKVPMEIRKKIYDAILKTSPKQLLECREFSKRLFPY